ncbi:MAG TPA: class I SAM-dependent methyltransferase [Candidatus Hydrogenedentes bacterium]|jgi:SAM-dependent methyltransferase|nr:class I SAM-dependent methyltransferase [Candidatus Hydrogenedentota bacterium]
MPEPLTPAHARKSASWKQRVFAWVLHAGNRLMRGVAPQRRNRLFSMLSGRVLEIGPGAGANLPYYPRGTTLFGLEPNRYLFRYLREEARRSARTMHLIKGRAESLGLRGNSIDAVVCTHVLCSVDDLDATFREILRVLKPGGLFIFFEHVAAPRATALRAVQRLLRPGWQKVGEGCRPDRELWRALEIAGFTQLTYEHFRVPWALIVSPHLAGWAFKPWNSA